MIVPGFQPAMWVERVDGCLSATSHYSQPATAHARLQHLGTPGHSVPAITFSANGSVSLSHTSQQARAGPPGSAANPHVLGSANAAALRFRKHYVWGWFQCRHTQDQQTGDCSSLG